MSGALEAAVNQIIESSKTKPKKEFIKPPQQATTQSSLSTQSGTLVS